MKKVCIISDLHLATSKKFDNFGPDKIPLFVKFINAVIKTKVDMLVLAGDIFELWQGSRKAKDKIAYIQKRYKRIFDVLTKAEKKGVKIVWLRGNHDDKCGKYLNWKRKYVEDIQGVGEIIHLHIEHGDRYDKTPLWLGKTASYVFGFFESLFGPKIQDFVDKISNNNTPSSDNYQGDLDEYVKGAHKIIDRAKKNTICVFGHTHQRKESPYRTYKKSMYFNSGTWINKKTDYILITFPMLDIVAKSYNGEAIV